MSSISVKGSVLRLPTEFKDVPIQRDYPERNAQTYFFIDFDPMSLTVEYADGSSRPVTYPGDANGYHSGHEGCAADAAHDRGAVMVGHDLPSLLRAEKGDFLVF